LFPDPVFADIDRAGSVAMERDEKIMSQTAIHFGHIDLYILWRVGGVQGKDNEEQIFGELFDLWPGAGHDGIFDSKRMQIEHVCQHVDVAVVDINNIKPHGRPRILDGLRHFFDRKAGPKAFIRMITEIFVHINQPFALTLFTLRQTRIEKIILLLSKESNT
jgi:hypothetical protein